MVGKTIKLVNDVIQQSSASPEAKYSVLSKLRVHAKLKVRGQKKAYFGRKVKLNIFKYILDTLNFILK